MNPSCDVVVIGGGIKEGVSECDPHPFRLSRYAEDDPVRAAYSVSLAG